MAATDPSIDPSPDDPRTAEGPASTVEAVTEAVTEAVEDLAIGPPPGWSTRFTAHLGGFDAVVDAQFDQRLRGRPSVDRVMYSVTELADFSLLWHLLAATRGVRSERHAAEALRVSTVLGVESTVVNGVLKSLFKRTRPAPAFERPHHLRMPLTTSFPSGHASAAFCAATLLAEGRPARTAAAWYGLATVVAASRVHVKIHHASDVLGGAWVGLVVGRVARRLWARP